ncbi:MAG: hypothetical protein WEB04_12295 [Dehalococcoidia bacterium]
MKRVVIGLLAVMALFAVLLSGGTQPEALQAASPGSANAPLLSCADVDGDGTVGLFGDIFAVAFLFGADADDSGTGEPDGYHPLYDVGDGNGDIDLFSDIFGVAFDFGAVCPAVDTQVAKATLWGIANLPSADDAAGIAALQALGYYRGSTDVSGQGVHYTKLQNWDATFDPEAPEGIVYNNGQLAAQLYVVEGGQPLPAPPGVGWGTYAASSFPPPTTPHDVDLEAPANGAPDGPACSPACSWVGGEGWHLHYYLCTIDIGTASAMAIPAVIVPSVQTDAGCKSFGGNDPLCTVPITTTPCYRWGQNVGWMGHLWNHELNPNQIPDTGGNNGRFADCVPDGSGWKAFNCPA